MRCASCESDRIEPHVAAPNIRRIQVDRRENAPPLQVTVDENAAEVFATERMPF